MTNYSLDFNQNWVMHLVPFSPRLAVSLFPACASASAPCNQRSVHKCVGIFPRSEGENALNRRAQYRCTGHGGECMECMDLLCRPVTDYAETLAYTMCVSVCILLLSQFHILLRVHLLRPGPPQDCPRLACSAPIRPGAGRSGCETPDQWRPGQLMATLDQ